jgi:hypothetical protein
VPPDDALSLTDALIETHRLYGVVPPYHVAWRAVVAGEIPAARVGRVYRVSRAVLPKLAALARPRPEQPAA